MGRKNKSVNIVKAEAVLCDISGVYSDCFDICNQRIQTDGFAEQNGRDAERAD